jgi:hypothetical protein
MQLHKKMVTVEIPESFFWAYVYWQKWWEQSLSGQFIYDFQDGGIRDVRELICRKPTKTKNSS